LQGNLITELPPGVFSSVPALQTLLLSSNQLTSIAAEDFALLPKLLTLSLRNNDISLVDPNIFNQSRFASPPGNLVLDMAGNPSVCRTGWRPHARSSIVYCSCSADTVGQSLPGESVASGCSSVESLGIVELPTVFVSASGASNNNNSVNISTPLANETASQLCRSNTSSCCSATAVDNATLELLTRYTGSTCALTDGYMADVIPAYNTVFSNISVYVLNAADDWTGPLTSPTPLHITLAVGQPASFSGVPLPFASNPRYSASNSFAVFASGERPLPMPLQLSAQTSGKPVAGLPPTTINVTQQTHFGVSAVVSHVVTLLVLSVVTCNNVTCNGGQCEFEMSPYQGPFACRCLPGLVGQFCEFPDRFADAMRSPAGFAFLCLVLSLLASAAVTLGHRSWHKSKSLTATNAGLMQRLLETEEEMGTLQRIWQIQASELTIEREIARGAFGVVLKAVWNDLPVAVKMLGREAGNMDAADAEEFEREVSFMRTVRHPHVVLFHGAGVFDTGLPFLVTEYMERGSLRKVLSDSPDIAWPQKLQFALDTARGMQHLHSLGAIHRDLKSGNLLVTQGFRIKVADFGTARLAGMSSSSSSWAPGPPGVPTSPSKERDNSATPMLTTMVGTALWMAPEILFKQSYTQKADVYSYAIVLFEILTQQVPWSELPSKFMVNRLEEALRSGKRPSASAARPEHHPEVAAFRALMERCWAQDPSARPSFDEVVQVSALCQAAA
jgi:hypothetical protein